MNQWWQYWKGIVKSAFTFPSKGEEIGHAANQTIRDDSIRKADIVANQLVEVWESLAAAKNEAGENK